MKVVIVLPTYNEKGNIEKVIEIFENEVVPIVKNHTLAILVADDNSPDGTADEVRVLMKKWKNIDIHQGEKHGLGAAYIRGMTYAIEEMKADVLFEMDADGQMDPRAIPDFLKKIDEGYDIVVGNRYSDGGSIPENWPIQRKAFSRGANLFVRCVFMKFSIHDWTVGYRAIKKEVFLKEKQFLTNYKGYIFQISFLHKVVMDGFKVAEVPIHFTDRTLGQSKIAPVGYIFEVVKYVLIARISEFKRFVKFLIVGGTGFIVQILAQEAAIFTGLTLFITHLFIPFAHVSDRVALSHAFGSAFGAEAAILSNFMFNNYWTFQDARRMKHRSRSIIRLLKFNATSFGSILIQFSAIWIAEQTFGPSVRVLSFSLPTRILAIVPTIIIFIIPLNYLIYNKIIWKTQFLKHDKKSPEA